MDLKTLKKFSKIDTFEDDDIVELQAKAAERYLIKAGVKKEYADPKCEDFELYTQAVCMLLGYWYENRSTVVIGTISKELEHSLTSIIVQLRS
ncbi:MAG: head-tail connector protein [Cellulosilyticaceae bacterium]